MSKKTKAAVAPHQDLGFFAPDSITRKVWGYPTSALVGIIRATVIEELDPNLIASVDATGDNYTRLATRYARTIQYFAAVAFADSETVVRMADMLVKIHSKAIGPEPVSGGRYDANDPDSQLWILITGWHSVLAAYERFGPGRLTEDEAKQYWADCAIAAELQTCDPADVPPSREEVRAYFESWRPKLVASEAAQKMMIHLLNGALDVIPRKGLPGLIRRPANWLLRTGTIATMPRYQRDLAGVRQSRVTGVFITIVLRAIFKIASRSVPLQRWVVGVIAPKTLDILEPHWQGIPPVNPVVVTPGEARARLGLVAPAEAHHELRKKQWELVFGAGEKPSDIGLIESQELLGSVSRPPG